MVLTMYDLLCFLIFVRHCLWQWSAEERSICPRYGELKYGIIGALIRRSENMVNSMLV